MRDGRGTVPHCRFGLKLMKLYLDNSFLNRPFDNLNITINRLETEILFWILDLIRERKFILVNSAVIEYENSFNPFPERKFFVEEILKFARIYQNINEKIYLDAKRLVKQFKIKNLDALHLAVAQYAKVDFFITCDYNLIKKLKGKLNVISPGKFFEKFYEKYKR